MDDLDSIAESEWAGPVERVERRELAAILEAAVLRLPAKYRLPLTLFHLEGLSHERVAAFLGKKVGTIKSLISRARATLRPILESYAKEALPMAEQAIQDRRLPDDFKDALMATIDAAEKGELDRLEALLQKHPRVLNERGGKMETTALHQSSWRGHTAIVELLLKRGAQPNIRDGSDKAYALHYAAEAGHLEIVKLLVENGADPNGLGDGHGLGVIGWATNFARTHTNVAEYLLAKGARHNMFSAVAMGDAETVRRLAQEDPGSIDRTPDSPWEADRRPLYVALIKRRPEMVSLLLDLGAEADFIDRHGHTTLDLAAMMGRNEIVQLLTEAGCRLPFPAAVALERKEVYEPYLRDHPDALNPGGEYEKLLFYASGFATGAFIEKLIALGAPVSPIFDDDEDSSIKGATPLHWAAFNGNLEVIRVLLHQGADATIKDAIYHSPPSGWADYNKQWDALKLMEELGAK